MKSSVTINRIIESWARDKIFTQGLGGATIMQTAKKTKASVQY